MEPFSASEWSFVAISTLTTLAGVALAATVITAGPRRRTNQALAFLLFAFAANTPTVLVGLLARDRALLYNAALYNGVFVTLIVFGYLHFLPLAVDAPLTRPLRRLTTSRAFLVLGVILAILTFIFHDLFLEPAEGGVTRLGRASHWQSTPLGLALALVLNLTLLFSFVVALQAYLRAPQASVAKARAKNYAIAFGVWDAAQIFGNLSPAIPGVPDAFVSTWRAGVYYPFFFLLFALTLARGLLKYQLFDFDLKLKWTLRRGSVAALFVAVFFVVAEIAQEFLAGALGWVAGAVAAGLLVFALRPIERAADRLADGAMPRVQPTPAYVQYKKLEVYKAAVESALEGDGEVTQREKDSLARLSAKLGIVAADADAIEAEVRTKLTSPRAP